MKNLENSIIKLYEDLYMREEELEIDEDEVFESRRDERVIRKGEPK